MLEGKKKEPHSAKNVARSGNIPEGALRESQIVRNCALYRYVPASPCFCRTPSKIPLTGIDDGFKLKSEFEAEESLFLPIPTVDYIIPQI